MGIITMAVEAFTTLSSVQYLLIAALIIFVSAGTYIFTRIHEREKAEQEKAKLTADLTKRFNETVRDMTQLVAVELNEESEHYRTYVELGDTFVPDENDTLYGVPDKHTVMTALRAKTTGATRRRTVAPDELPLK